MIFLFFVAMFLYHFLAGTSVNEKQEMSLVSSKNTMLQQWNEQEISTQLVRLQDNPPVLLHYIDSVRQRFIDNQNTRTAQSRISFLEKQVKILQLASEYSDVQNELSLKNRKYQNDLLRVNLENQTLSLDFKDEASERELQRLGNDHRKIEKELELVKLKRELDALNNPPQPEQKKSSQEIREEKRQNLKSRIQKLNEMIIETRNDRSMNETERQAALNQLERKKFDLNDELLDLI